MRKILVPQDIQLVDPLTGAPMRDGTGVESKPVAFREIAVRGWVNSSAWPTGHLEMLRLQSVILPKLVEAHGGTVLLLEDADWERLAVAARAPLGNFGPLAAAQLIPFVEAVLHAPAEAPNGISVHHADRELAHRGSAAGQ